MEHDVQQINQVHEVVQAEPNEQCFHGDFSKAEAEDDHPKVVQKGKGDHKGPVVTQPTSGIEDKRPIASAKDNQENLVRKCVSHFDRQCTRFRAILD